MLIGKVIMAASIFEELPITCLRVTAAECILRCNSRNSSKLVVVKLPIRVRDLARAGTSQVQHTFIVALLILLTII